MIFQTFLHIPGIGARTEKRLWALGVHSWQDCLNRVDELFRSPAARERVRRSLEASLQAIRQNDAAFFRQMLPTRESWRLYGAFMQDTLFLDIETTGLSTFNDEITVVGTYDGRDARAYVQGRDLREFAKQVRRHRLVVTYNGASFDLPFLRRSFPGATDHLVHIDLRHHLGRLGYKGGLKTVERALGLERPEALMEIDGFMAVALWHQHKRGDHRALPTLTRYCLEDVVSLKPLMELAYNALARAACVDFTQLEISPRPSLDLPYFPEVVRDMAWRGATGGRSTLYT